MEALKITLVGQGPDVSARLKTISYAPFALKAYLDFHLPVSLKNKVKTNVLDFRYDRLPSDMTSRILADEPDIVGFSVYLWNYDRMLECARNIKTVRKDTCIILGGPQVSPIAEEVIAENPYIDIISFASAAGEVTLLDIVEAIFYKRDFNTINGICYYDTNGNIVKTSADVRLINYKTSPSPYSGGNGLFDENIGYMAVIESSRGCPYDCGYCFWGHGKHNIEYFPLNRTLEDIEIVCNNTKVKHIYFSDSNLLADIERAETIIKHIIKQKSQVKVSLEINYIHIKESTAKLLTSLPDFQFLLAVQTSNPKALKCIGRTRPSPETFAQKLDELKQWAPEAKYQVDIMLGLPGDDFNGFIQTLDFVLSLEPFYIVLNHPVYLLPGSRFFENREALRLRYTPTPPFSVIETDTFPKKDIEQALKIAIWTQVFTFYYPAIAKFFYAMARLDGVRIQRLLRWIKTIESKINLFDLHGNLVDVATLSTKRWNRLKKIY